MIALIKLTIKLIDLFKQFNFKGSSKLSIPNIINHKQKDKDSKDCNTNISNLLQHLTLDTTTPIKIVFYKNYLSR
ncbi:hypothetical protein CYJ29_05815 [Aerococcus loyolae]|nr:hypothetical protein HMPREF2784_04890 [Aerococcus loyolae]PKY85651.1 hypothetical protein CYJ30_05530 [Aerococcus loyolae]PKZ03519.1 hypothetical protein CYJ29_05815 [Aerococcus loyolae]